MTNVEWTIAYRKPRANRFLRVDLSLTWQEASDLAGRLSAARPDLQVWITITAAYEASDAAWQAAEVAAGRRTQAFADSYLEDHRNILVDSGRRVQIREGGTLTEFGTDIALEVAAQQRNAAEVIHHVSRYGNVISCGATGPVRCEEFAKDVTCPDCNAADSQHLIDNAHAEALDEDAARYEEAHARAIVAEQWREWRDRMWTRAVRLNAATPNMSIAELSLIEEAHEDAITGNAARDRLAQNDTLRWPARIREARDKLAGGGRPTGLRAGMQAVRDEDHARALDDALTAEVAALNAAEDSRRGVTR